MKKNFRRIAGQMIACGAVTFAALLTTGCSDNNDEPGKEDIPKDVPSNPLSMDEKDYLESYNDFAFTLLQQTRTGNSVSEDITIPVLAVGAQSAMLSYATENHPEKGMLLFGYGDIEPSAVNQMFSKIFGILKYGNVDARYAFSCFYNDNYNLSSALQGSLSNNYSMMFKSIGDGSISGSVESWLKDNFDFKGTLDFEKERSLDFAIASSLELDLKLDRAFDKSKTTKEAFKTYLSSGKEVKMLNGTFNLPYAVSDGTVIVRIPAEKGKYNITLMMPDNNKTMFHDFVNHLSYSTLKAADFKDRNVDLKIPELNISYSSDIMTAYAQTIIRYVIGLPTPKELELEKFFDNGIAHLSTFPIHSSFSFDSSEAESESVTAAAGYATRAGEENVTAHYNRPFVYVVENTSTGAIVLAGAVCEMN